MERSGKRKRFSGSVEQEGEMKSVEERLKQLIEYVKCPETGSEHFGEWGYFNEKPAFIP